MRGEDQAGDNPIQAAPPPGITPDEAVRTVPALRKP